MTRSILLRAVVMSVALVTAGVSAPPAAADGDTRVETGSGHIECWLILPLVSRDCAEPTSNAFKIHELDVEDASKVTFTVSWTPVSDDAKEMDLFLNGNTSCSCDWSAVARGPSPLSVTLSGSAVHDTTMDGALEPASICESGDVGLIPPRNDCHTPPFKLIQDQDYHYEWVVER